MSWARVGRRMASKCDGRDFDPAYLRTAKTPGETVDPDRV